MHFDRFVVRPLQGKIAFSFPTQGGARASLCPGLACGWAFGPFGKVHNTLWSVSCTLTVSLSGPFRARSPFLFQPRAALVPRFALGWLVGGPLARSAKFITRSGACHAL